MSSRLKFSVGYQLPDRWRFSDIVSAFAPDIEEVYFPWIDVANGRGIGIVGEGEQRILEDELAVMRAAGVRLNMLWNAPCYGAQSLSSELERKIDAAIRKLLEGVGLEAVTTASLFVADCVKKRFPKIDVRASVNMGVGSVAGLACLAPYFDSFYVARELNRFPERIRALKEWCDAHGKRLGLLANSGCLRECPAHAFHDNLVAHEAEIAQAPSPWCGFRGVCWDYYADPANRVSFLADSTWIRPEEIDAYAELVHGVKLATRVHRNPERIIEGYVGRRFSGNILGLMEPDFSGVCRVENEAFSAEWLENFGRLSDAARDAFCRKEWEHVRR